MTVNGSALEFVEADVEQDDSVVVGKMILDAIAANAVGYQTYRYLPADKYRVDIMDNLDQDDDD